MCLSRKFVDPSFILSLHPLIFIINLPIQILNDTSGDWLHNTSIMMPTLYNWFFRVSKIFCLLSGQRKMLIKQIIIFELEFFILLLGSLVLAAVEYLKINRNLRITNIWICSDLFIGFIIWIYLTTIIYQVFIIGIRYCRKLILFNSATWDRDTLLLRSVTCEYGLILCLVWLFLVF
jgi:hypothetical protein